MQGGSIDLTTHQYAELLRVPLPQAATPMVYQQPLAATLLPPLVSHDQYQMSNQQLPQQVPCCVSYPQQPQQLTGQSPFEPVRQQVQADWSQGPYQRQIPMFSQHEDFIDATPAASASSGVHDSWNGSPSSDVPVSVLYSTGSAVANSNPMLTSRTSSLHQLFGEGDMLPPDPRLLLAAPPIPPLTAPQQVCSINLGQQAFGQPLPEPASPFGWFDVNTGHPQDFMHPSTTSVGHQFPDGCSPSASANLGDTIRSSSLSHVGLPQRCQWPGQSNTVASFSTGQTFQGSGEMPQSIQEPPSSTGQLAQGLGLVPQRAAGAFEAGAVPGRPVYGHSQSYSRVPSRRIVRGPSFTQRGERALDHSA